MQRAAQPPRSVWFGRSAASKTTAKRRCVRPSISTIRATRSSSARRSADDAVVPLVRRLIAAYPHVPARLLIGNETISDNPKLNNVYKGWRAAAHDWIVMADSNVLMPRDYIQRLLGGLARGYRSRRVAAGRLRPDGFWAELECAFLNTYQARWQYVADSASASVSPRANRCSIASSLIEQAGGLRGARGRAGGGRGHDQGRARRRPARSPRGRAVRAAARSPRRPRGVGASTALGAAAAVFFQALLPAGNSGRRHLRRCRPQPMSPPAWGCRWPAPLPSQPSGTAPKPRSPMPPDGI